MRMMAGLLAAGGVTTAVTTIVYTNFSARVMPSLAGLPAAQGISRMQGFNRTAVQPPFMLCFFGSAAVAAVLLVRLARGERSLADLLAGAGAVASLAAFVLTIAYHVPRNDALARLDPAAPSSVEAWETYLREWTRANKVRAALSGIGVGLFVAAAVRQA